MRHLKLALILLLAAPLFGAYQYYYSDNFPNINTTYWTPSSGLIHGGSYGLWGAGNVTSLVPVPDGSSDYEVKAVLRVSGPPTNQYRINLRRSADGQTYYRVTLYSSGYGSATLVVTKTLAGVTYTLGTTSVYDHDGMVLRAVIHGQELRVYVDGALRFLQTDSSISAGVPGFGGNLPNYTAISLGELGPIDRTAPSAIPVIDVSRTSTMTAVYLQWPAQTDDPDGAGVYGYLIYRDGQLLDRVTGTSYVDQAVEAGRTYSYSISAEDFHGNASTPATFDVSLPSEGLPPIEDGDGRRTGVRSTGSYWGAGGEQIDTLSGNLNFTLPLLTASARGGMSVPFALSYNSQMWRKDSGGTWKLGGDVGYGFGWRLQAGSITPVYADGQVHHFLFRDSTGASYRLGVCTGGHHWTSTESIFLEFDASFGRLWFPNGSFWVMGSTSAGTEQDSGTRYPTLMQDTNGNQIVVRYYPGIGMSEANTSARIQEIEDIRATDLGNGHFASYVFTYNGDAIPHLTSIQFRMGLNQSYAFHYWENQSLVSPFSPPTSYGNVDLLQYIETVGPGLQHNFEYSTGGELSKVVFPYGGWLRWEYRDFTFTDGRTLREVQNRYLKTIPGGAETTYAFTREESDSGHYIHTAAFLNGPAGNGQKAWFFNTSLLQWRLGLLSSFEERPAAGQTSKRKQEYTWTRTSNLHPYLSEVLTTLDQGTSFVKQSKTAQVLDAYGNVTESRVYGYGSLTTPVRTYTNTYATSQLPCQGCSDRLLTSTMSDGTNQTTLVTNTYDGIGFVNIDGSYPRLHDTNYGNGYFSRGNLTQRVAGGLTSNFTYDITGTVREANDGHGHSVAITSISDTNYAAPSTITPNSQANLAQNYAYNEFLGVTAATGPNSSTVTTAYDVFARPTSTTSPHGAVTTYTYNNPARTTTATTNGRWTKATMDGLGRTVKVESGYGTTTVSIADTEYDSCGCSPLGKVKRTSLPYAPGGTVYWTTYSYDCLGRTVSIAQPGNTGATSYVYEGNAVTVTDPAGKWKKYSTDALGNLVQVIEPDPSLGNVQANYTYNVRDQLTLVSMPRGGTTQTRTFNYDLATGRLTSATNPENGTVSYVYNADGTLARKTDAKGQCDEYTYDSFGRPTQKRGYQGCWGNSFQYVDYVYDSGVNGWGRLTSSTLSTWWGDWVTQAFTYTPAGLVTSKTQSSYYGSYPANYTYDNEGRTVSTQYPFSGPTFTYTYDAMGRPTKLTDNQPTPLDWVKDVAYNAAGQITTMSYARDPNGSSYFTETRQYNILQQLTRLTVPGVMDHEYRFSATQNDGRITQRKDWVSGEEITYQYDSLKRLITAQTTGPDWGQSFGYDGFGNLLSQTVTKGSAPSLNVTVDPATNRITNSGMSYDANGSLTAMPGLTMTYDTDNRMISNSSGDTYQYDAGGQRVLKKNGYYTWVYFYGIDGNLLNVPGGYNVYFGKKLIYNGAAVATDRLGSVVHKEQWTETRYFPYGDEPSTTEQNRPKFATYFRDGSTALDYAQQRYYASTIARFTSPDRSGKNESLANPQSFNRYAYVNGDPVNFNDPTGQFLFAFWDDLGFGGGGGGGYDLEMPRSMLWAHSDEQEAAYAQRVGHTNAAIQANAALAEGRVGDAAAIAAADGTLELAVVPTPTVSTSIAYDPGGEPTAIKATSDCTKWRLAGMNLVVERDITYRIFAGNAPMQTGYIEETITPVTGKPEVTGGRGNEFEDIIAVGPNLKPFTVRQTFTATVRGQAYRTLPLYPSPTAQKPVQNNTNIIEAFPGGVFVNGNAGAKPGACSF